MNEPENVELTQGGQKKLGSLLDLRNLPLAEAIRQRGGGQSQVNPIRTNYQSRKVGELANLAAEGDKDAKDSD